MLATNPVAMAHHHYWSVAQMGAEQRCGLAVVVEEVTVGVAGFWPEALVAVDAPALVAVIQRRRRRRDEWGASALGGRLVVAKAQEHGKAEYAVRGPVLI